MMNTILYISSALFGAFVVLLAYTLMSVLAARPRRLVRALDDLRRADIHPTQGSERRPLSRLFARILLGIGERIVGSSERAGLKERLARAGYRSQNAIAMYWGARLFFLVVAVVLGFFISSVAGLSPTAFALLILWLGAVGWLGPNMYLTKATHARELEIRSALPDALDLLVVCMDAGLGLNQAWVRVGEEMRSVSPALADELALVNFQIRAGVPRDEALRSLGTRTQSPDLRSLASILIQTDRFGTSVSQALRVQSESLRTRRQQRAEEAAAKTPVKLSFPLVLCLMPALFIVLLGGSVIQMIQTFATFK